MRRRPDRRGGVIRHLVAEEAARLMVEEGIGQYFDAKRRAAKTVLHGRWARTKDLPSNGEIREAILRRAALSDGLDQTRRLFAMRATALEIMGALEPWHPRLIGSVWSGHARRGSDIDLHVFTEDPDPLTEDLDQRGWRYEREEVLVRVPRGFQTYLHLHLLEHRFPVELSVYSLQQRRERTRSSTDGRPIDRVSAARLKARLRAEHTEAMREWEQTGALAWTEPERHGRFDSLVR